MKRFWEDHYSVVYDIIYDIIRRIFPQSVQNQWCKGMSGVLTTNEIVSNITEIALKTHAVNI
jgi:hypothetical protein